MKKPTHPLSLFGLFILVPLINYLGSLTSSTFNLPIFFDSLGTVLGVLLGNFWIGALGGATYNVVSAFLNHDPLSSIWALSNIFIALTVWLLIRSKKVNIEKYSSVFVAGLFLALINSLFTTAISQIVYKGVETYSSAIILQKCVSNFISNNFLTLALTHLIMEIIDKSFILLFAFLLYKVIKLKKEIDPKKLILPILVLVTAFGFTLWINTQTKLINIKNEQDLLIKNQTQQAISMLETVYEGYEEGQYPIDQAKSMGADLLRWLRYGNNNEGYFWADTSDGTNVVLYGDTAVEGKNRINSYVGGVYHVQEIIKNGKKPGGGYTDYYYTKKGGTTVLPKRGFSMYFEPFDWVIGTGYYLEDLGQTSTINSKNSVENNTPLINLFGYAFPVPQGIVQQSKESSASATRITYTIGNLTSQDIHTFYTQQGEYTDTARTEFMIRNWKLTGSGSLGNSANDGWTSTYRKNNINLAVTMNETTNLLELSAMNNE